MMKSFMTGLQSVLASAWCRWLFKTIRDGALSYMAASSFQPTKAWAYGLGVAVLSAVVHGLEEMSDSPAPAVSVPKTSLMVLLLLGAMALFAPQAGAWTYPVSYSKLCHTDKLSLASATAEAPTQEETVWATVPLVNGNFSLSSPNVYGLGVCQAIGLFDVKPMDNNTTAVTPYFFVGAGLSLNMKPFIDSVGTSLPVLDYGVLVGLPATQGIPEIEVEYQWETGHPGSTITVGVAAPFEIGALVGIF